MKHVGVVTVSTPIRTAAGRAGECSEPSIWQRGLADFVTPGDSWQLPRINSPGCARYVECYTRREFSWITLAASRI